MRNAQLVSLNFHDSNLKFQTDLLPAKRRGRGSLKLIYREKLVKFGENQNVKNHACCVLK